MQSSWTLDNDTLAYAQVSLRFSLMYMMYLLQTRTGSHLAFLCLINVCQPEVLPLVLLHQTPAKTRY
jgi:hypothetical protein